MATGRTHEKINIFILFLLLPLLFNWFKDWLLTALCGLFYLIGTFYLSPDLDMENTLPFRRWGKLRFIWYIYSKIIPHRSSLSHSFLIGTIFRLIWLSGSIFFLGFVVALVLELLYTGDFIQAYVLSCLEIKSFCFVNQKFLIPVFVGLLLSPLLHEIVDVLWSFFN